MSLPFYKVGHDVFIEQPKILQYLFDAKGANILDAATGVGRFAIEFAKAGAITVVGIDISDEYLDEARRLAAKEGVNGAIRFEHMDVENLTFPDGSFDAVCCMNAIIHFRNQQQAVNEFGRVLKSGGIFLGSVHLPVHNWRVYLARIHTWRDLVDWIFYPIYCSKTYHRFVRPLLGKAPAIDAPMDLQTLTSLFNRANLDVVKTVYQGHPKSPAYVVFSARKR
jgi:ubiquinone/menaquinone biosynthesis C-methylase UbiE